MNKQTIANNKWQQKNKERAKYLSDRSRARSFIKNQATLDDLLEFKDLIKYRGGNAIDVKIIVLETNEQIYKIYRVFTIQRLLINDNLTIKEFELLIKNNEKFTLIDETNKTLIKNLIDSGYELIDISDSLTPHFDIGKYDKHYGTIDNKNTRRNRL